MEVPVVSIIEIMPTRIWIESGMMGERIVVMQHDGCRPFDYATFGYDYAYTSNAGTWEAARRLALSLGAVEPIQERARELHMPTADEVRRQIAGLQGLLMTLERTETTSAKKTLPGAESQESA